MKLWVFIAIAIAVGIAILAVSIAYIVPQVLQEVEQEIEKEVVKRNESPADRDARVATVLAVETALENIPKMFAGVTQEQIRVVSAGDKFIYRVLGADGKTLAWVAGGKLKGRWDDIEMLVALDPGAETITKLHVVYQRERYWQRRVVRARYVESFVGKKAEPILMVKKTAPGEQQVQAVTKATVTSKTICQIVNTAVGELKACVTSTQPQ